MTRILDLLRLVLGVVLTASALDYFLPALVPLVEQSTFVDAQAAQLVGVLDTSGLFAVGKFIQLVAGLLLIVDRAVPFALAAVMPTLVCGTYIAMILEGDPLHVLAALALLALTGLLMLAYLPYYAPMLAAGHLADGEDPVPGGNYESLFVNPFSGAPTRAYLGGAVALGVAIFAYWQVIPYDNGTTGLVTLVLPGAVFLLGLTLSLMRGRRVSP